MRGVPRPSAGPAQCRGPETTWCWAAGVGSSRSAGPPERLGVELEELVAAACLVVVVADSAGFAQFELKHPRRPGAEGVHAGVVVKLRPRVLVTRRRSSWR